jgi:hypothetical protein
MKINRRIWTEVNGQCRGKLAAVSTLLLATAFVPIAQAQTAVPADAQASCTVPSATFDTWFARNKVTRDGAVVPANSVAFNHSTPNPPQPNTINCNFYQWSQQMFLWLTSPAPESYGGRGERVYDSPTFYTVLADGTLIPNQKGFFHHFGLRKAKPINTADGQADGSGNGNAALMGQGDKVVYYSMHVNDVYAYFAKQNLPLPATYSLQFPTTQTQLDAIQQYAKSQGVKKPFPDANALTIEVKIAWVEASGLDKRKYVTMEAEVPTFHRSEDNAVWAQTGKKKTLLAMVGVHIVGSVAGHPEMIWATFEHDTNAPDAEYAYVNASGTTVTHAQEIPQNMLFAANGSTGPFNQEHMRGVGIAADPTALSLVRLGNFAVTPSDTLRRYPWGANDQAPNPVVLSAAASNTEVISINNNVRGMLKADDVRRNYLFIGATWTNGGAAPSVMPLPPGGTSNQVGTSSLANTMMETYVTVKNNLNNCFACHTGQQGTSVTSPNTNTVAVSHIFSGLITTKLK